MMNLRNKNLIKGITGTATQAGGDMRSYLTGKCFGSGCRFQDSTDRSVSYQNQPGQPQFPNLRPIAPGDVLPRRFAT